MQPVDVAFAGIAAQAEMLRRKEISARELVESQLERITRLDPGLNCFRVVLAERALLEAAQADGRIGAGDERPLLGVPVGIKDGWDLAGELTTHGTGAYGAPPTEDSEFVTRLRAAGAIVIGKTHQPEFAQWMFTESSTWGVTRNPWDLQRTPGGSSGGSGAAVAAGLVGAASASDGAGSIRIPAAACGLFGLKPQRGRVPLTPFVDHWHGLSVAGTLTRSVLDTALWLDVVSGSSQRDPNTLPNPSEPFVAAAGRTPRPLRIAVSFASPTLAPVGAEQRSAVTATAELLASLGHTILHEDPDFGVRAGGIYSDIGASLSLRYLRGAVDDAAAIAHPRRLMRRTRRLARLGSLIPTSLLERDRTHEADLTARVNRVFDRCDLLLTPTVPVAPLAVGALEGRGALACMLVGLRGFGAAFTGPWNVTGQPAAAVPAGFDAAGLPLSVQLVGRPADEITLIEVAAQIEAERPWALARPPGFDGTG
ncbi:MAG: amidase [Thermoleophilaceae bacterium]|nr:amidase [Thermoleophilaceae bacterium]